MNDPQQAGSRSQGDWSPGWYEYPHGGGQRYWDGKQWTEHFAPPPPKPPDEGRSFVRTVVAVWAGFILGWGTIWLGAQFAEDTFYWPIKTVVDQDDLSSVDEALEQLGPP